MNRWEQFKVFSAVLVPAAIALVGHWYTSAIAERESEARFVELGVSILQATPTKETINLRTWATEVLNRYSGVPINEATQKDLIENLPIPSSNPCEPVIIPEGATCENFYAERSNWGLDKIRNCGLYQVSRYKDALNIQSQSEWGDFLKHCK